MESLPRRIERNIAALHNTFSVDDSSPSGLSWKDWTPSVRRPTNVAGRLITQGYWQVGFGGARLLVHRIIWIIVNNETILPGMEVDHEDGNRRNNGIENLQLFTSGQNSRARNGVNKTNRTGFLGVSKHVKGLRWLSRFHRDGKLVYLGCFDDPVLAARRYNEAVIAWAKEHGEIPRYLNPV